MERVFKTYLRSDHKFGQNAFVRGRIRGMQDILCNEERQANGLVGLAHEKRPDGSYIIPIKCTAEQYLTLVSKVEEYYPGLCIFDYDK